MSGPSSSPGSIVKLVTKQEIQPAHAGWLGGNSSFLFRLDSGGTNDLAPFFGFVGDELPYSAGEPDSGVPPISASRALIVGSARPALTSRLRRSTMSAGVPFGAAMPNHELASKPGTKSATMGMSGSASERLIVHTASGRSRSARINPIDAVMVANPT